MSVPSTDSLYLRIRVIGKGSYGEVWLVKHKKDKKQYVLKKMDIHNASKRERKAAEQEAKLLSKLKHPNIVSYKDSFQGDDGFLYIAMGHCEGGDLYTRLKEQKGTPLEERQVVEWFVQIAMALQYMHERNILHRDLKTQNIFLTKSKIIKVGDLGIARVLDSSSDMATTLIGTPYYMSPELFSNKPYNHKSDVWALGCCVYEMATLKHAFNARDMNALVYKILTGRMPAMPRKYSPELTLLIRAMLSQNPDRRPSVNRILRDPYIKKNIAIFLEGTKKSRASSSAAGRPAASSGARRAGATDTPDCTRPRSGSSRRPSETDVTDGPETARSSVSSVGAVSRVYEAAEDGAERSLEPLNVGPELEPITEETTPESTPRVVVPPARRPVLTSAGQIRTEAKVATVCKDGVSRRDRQRERAYSDSKHAQVGVCENRTENVDRSATSAEVIATDAQRPVMRPKAGCVLAEDVAEGRGANGTQLPSARGSSSKPANIPPSCNGAHRLPSHARRKRAPLSARGVPSDPPPAVPRQHSNSGVCSNKRSVLDHPRLAVETPRPLPPRPASAGTPQPTSSGHRRTPPGIPSESGYSSASSVLCASKDSGAAVGQPQQTPRGPNLSARERRRQRKDVETPRTSRSVEVADGRHVGRPRVTQSVSSGLQQHGQRAGSIALADECHHSEVEKRVKHRQPSLTQDSSSSDSEAGPEQQKEKENRRCDREMNNFISLLNTTLKLNRKSGGKSDMEDAGDRSEDAGDRSEDAGDRSEDAGDRSDNNGGGRSDNNGGDRSDNNGGGRSDNNGSGTKTVTFVDTESSQADGDVVVAVDVSGLTTAGGRSSTLTTTGRLWERIALLRKDCIHGLGVVKLKQAYDILDQFEADELEPKLISLLGSHQFNIYAGKIWQLKFCEEAAFNFS